MVEAAGFGARLLDAPSDRRAGDKIPGDLILLDVVTVPEGAEAAVAAAGGACPILLLLSRNDLTDTELIDTGNDFIVDPCVPDELNARLRRLAAVDSSPEVISIGGLTIKPDSYEAAIDDTQLKLTFKEYELLKVLAENAGRVLTRQALLNQIWEYDYYGGTRTVDGHIRRLRAKLGIEYGSLIETIRQVGYRFKKSL